MSIKNEERKIVKKRMSVLTTEYLDKSSSIICEKTIMTKCFLEAKVVFIYLSFQREVETQKLIETALSMGKKVAIPRISNGEMLSIDIETVKNFGYNRYGIKEPIDGSVIIPDLVIMPLLAFDSNRNRLGRGKGYYDKYMKNVRAESIALAFSFQKMECLCVEEWDYRPDMIITEEEILK